MNLKNLIEKKEVKLAIMGLGHVGLPLALEFCQAGFKVFGLDKDEERIEKLRKGFSYITDITDNEIVEVIKKNNFFPTTSFKILSSVDIICICVPTPLNKNREPDLTYIHQAVEKIYKYLRKPQLIILESTTYPGTTEEIILPKLEEKGLKAGKDFYLAFSPERVDPGNRLFRIKNTPRVIGGVTKKCTEVAKTLYSQIVDKVIIVSSPRTAEMTKLLENIFRSVNIALANELTLLCDKMNINIWEVIEAASTKPFGFMTFYPGPGLGGHCLPIDPFYLAWKAKEFDFRTKFIELSGEINTYMPYFVLYKIRRALNSQRKSVKDSKILILGVTYKKDVADCRESPAEKIIALLRQNEAKIYYNDPYIPEIYIDGRNIKLHSVPLKKEFLRKVDCVVIVSDHSTYDWEWIVKNSRLIVDTRNALKDISSLNIIRL